MLNSRYTIIRFDNFLKVVKSFNKNGISNGVNDFFHCVLTAGLLFERRKLLIIHHFYLITTETSVRDFFFAYLAPLRDNFYGY